MPFLVVNLFMIYFSNSLVCTFSNFLDFFYRSQVKTWTIKTSVTLIFESAYGRLIVPWRKLLSYMNYLWTEVAQTSFSPVNSLLSVEN